MPNQQSHATAIRAPGHSIRAFAVFFVGAVVVSGTVTADAANDTLNLAVTASVGTLTDAKYGMEVVVMTSSGAFKLRTHIRNAGVISSSNLPVRELSYGTAQVVAGDTFQVLNEYRLHDRLVGATTDDGRFPPDYLPYSAQNSALYPVCCSGGHTAAFVDGYLTQAVPETYATVQRTGSTSYTVDPTSNPAHVAHLWTLPSGVAFAPGSANTDADPVLRVNVGSYVIQHAFTDTDNGTTTTQYTVAIVCDATHQPYDMLLQGELASDEQYGWHCSVRVFQDADLTAIPDGSLCILFSQERINGAWQSFGNVTPGQEHILAVGYTHRDTNQAEAAIQKTFFDVVSPLQRLDEIAGYSKVMEQAATPDTWSKVATLTTKIATILLVYYYTTWIQAGFDLIFDAGYLDKTYPALYLQRSTPIQQVRELAHSVDARVTCDPVGRIDIYTWQPFIPLDERDAVTVTFILSGADIIDLEFARAHDDQVEQMKTAGFTAGTSPQPIFSLYPGSAPGEAVSAPTWERLICDDQPDLNARTGRYGALADAVFINADGLKQRAFEIKLTLFGSYNFFRFYKEFVKFSLTGTSNLRGIDLSAFRYWLKAVSITYAGGTARTTLTLQAETNAPAGTTYTPPANAVPPIYTPPPLVLVNPTLGLGRGTVTLFALNNDGYLYYCGPTLTGGGWDTDSPTWARVAYSLGGYAVTCWSFDAFCPAGLGTGTEVRGWLATGRTIFRVTHAESPTLITYTQCLNPDGSPFVFAQLSIPRSLFSERGIPNRLLCVSNGGNDGTTWLTSSVDGVHLAAEINIDTDGTAFSLYPAAYVSPRSNLMIASTHNNLHQSTAASPSFGGALAGLTFVSGGALAGWHTGGIHVPFNQPTDDIFYIAGVGAGATAKLYRGSLSGATLADITPVISGTPYTGFFPYSLQTSPTDRLIGAAVGWSAVGRGGTGTYCVLGTRDGGASWVQIVTPSAVDFNHEYAQVQVTDDNTSFHYGYNSLGLCQNLNSASPTVTSKLGNIHAAYGDVGLFISLWGG